MQLHVRRPRPGLEQEASEPPGLGSGQIAVARGTGGFAWIGDKGASKFTALRTGTPVALGAGDFPAALLGAGVTKTGAGCEITGTSTLLALLSDRPAPDAIVSNLL